LDKFAATSELYWRWIRPPSLSSSTCRPPHQERRRKHAHPTPAWSELVSRYMKIVVISGTGLIGIEGCRQVRDSRATVKGRWLKWAESKRGPSKPTSFKWALSRPDRLRWLVMSPSSNVGGNFCATQGWLVLGPLGREAHCPVSKVLKSAFTLDAKLG